MIELQNFPDDVVAVVCKGKVTRSDYDGVVIPAVDKAFRSHDKVRLYYEISRDFAGMEAGAMLEDFKVGMRHLPRWERIAVVTDIAWIKYAVRLCAFLIRGATRVFPVSQAGEARVWIATAL